jgi:hypothetical protein
MTFGEQNTEKEAHDQLSFSFDQGVNILDTAEIVSTDCFLSFINCFSYLLKLSYQATFSISKFFPFWPLVSSSNEQGNSREDRSIYWQVDAI